MYGGGGWSGKCLVPSVSASNHSGRSYVQDLNYIRVKGLSPVTAEVINEVKSMKERILVGAMALLLWSVPPHVDAQTTSSPTSPQGDSLRNQSGESGTSRSQGASPSQSSTGTQSATSNDDDDGGGKPPKPKTKKK